MLIFSPPKKKKKKKKALLVLCSPKEEEWLPFAKRGVGRGLLSFFRR